MALGAESRIGVDLSDGNVETFQAVGVEGRLDIAFQHSETKIAAQMFQSALENGCLARAGRTHHVYDIGTGGIELFPVRLGEGVVGVEDALRYQSLSAGTFWESV